MPATQRTDCELLKKKEAFSTYLRKKSNLAEILQQLKREPGGCNPKGTLVHPQEQLQPQQLRCQGSSGFTRPGMQKDEHNNNGTVLYAPTLFFNIEF